MSARKWHRQQQRSLISRRGTESARGDASILAELPADRPRRRPPSKEELRAQAAAALATFAGSITKCPTGARAK
jgi:hypothetical protein